MGKAETLVKKFRRVPFGILAGAFGMVVFFATVGLVVAYLVNSGIAGQTARTVTFLDNWYQALLFVVDIISALIAAASLAMYIVKKVYVGREKKAEAGRADHELS